MGFIAKCDQASAEENGNVSVAMVENEKEGDFVVFIVRDDSTVSEEADKNIISEEEGDDVRFIAIGDNVLYLEEDGDDVVSIE